MQNIAIFGSGGFGREVAMLIEQINAHSEQWNLLGFFDDSPQAPKMINRYPLLGSSGELKKVTTRVGIVIAIGSPAAKRKVIERIDNENIFYPVLIHPTVLKGKEEYVSIGEGTIICAANILTVNIIIGKHVILNLACTVGHDTVISDYASFMPSVNISGEVMVGEGVFVGTGAKIINKVEIGSYTIVGAGAVVSKSLPANCTAVGIPAKPIKFHG